MVEKWKPLYGFEKTHAISNLGKVKRTKGARGSYCGRILKISKRKNNGSHRDRPYVWITVNKKSKNISLNRLVCLTWHGKPPTPKHQAAHWDGDPWNNDEQNLRWATQLENEQDKKRHGRWNHGSQRQGDLKW